MPCNTLPKIIEAASKFGLEYASREMPAEDPIFVERVSGKVFRSAKSGNCYVPFEFNDPKKLGRGYEIK